MLEHPKFERKLSSFSPKDWEELAALDSKDAKIAELPTSRFEEEGSSVSISPSEIKLIGNAVISHFDENKSALFNAQVGAFLVLLCYDLTVLIKL